MIIYVAELIFEMWFLEAKFYENMDNRVQPRTVPNRTSKNDVDIMCVNTSRRNP